MTDSTHVFASFAIPATESSNAIRHIILTLSYDPVASLDMNQYFTLTRYHLAASKCQI